MEQRHEQLHGDDWGFCNEHWGVRKHIAICVDANKKLYMSINGALDFSTTLNEGNFATAAATLAIGAWPSQTTNRLVGKIDELRIGKGVARYVAPFTPA